MPLVGLAWKSARARAGATILTLIAIALSTALILGVEKIRVGARAGFAQTVSGADLIVGARSGPVNLLLYAVFRLGDPTANVSWETYEAFASRPSVAWTIPLSLGDSHGGFRVLGTNTDYFERYRYGERRPLAFAEGRAFDDVHDAVLGAEAARELGYGLQREFAISHGVKSAAFAEHGDHPFTVVGILKRTGTPVDRTIHISLEGMEAVHEDWSRGAPPSHGRKADDRHDHDHDHDDHDHDHDDDRAGDSDADEEHAHDGRQTSAHGTPDAVTAFLVGLNSKSAVLPLQRAVNTYRAEALTGVIPGVALSQLWRTLGPAEQALRAISFVVVAAGLTGLLTTLLSTLNERRREIAVLRAVGARRRDVFSLLVLEATVVAGAGAVIGAIAVNVAFAFFGRGLEASIGAPLGPLGLSAYDAYVVASVTALGFALGLAPGWIAYKRSLSDGLSVRI
ncbi:MAG: ABC transporter permease [Parvularculaceae bacterium]